MDEIRRETDDLLETAIAASQESGGDPLLPSTINMLETLKERLSKGEDPLVLWQMGADLYRYANDNVEFSRSAIGQRLVTLSVRLSELPERIKNPNITEVELPVLLDGESRGVEPMPVEQIGPNRFRAIYSPVFVEGLAAGDEFELSTESLEGYKVLKHGGNLAVQLYLAEAEHAYGPEAAQLRREVEAIGGLLNGGYRRVLVFTIPASVGVAQIERLFDEALGRIPGSEWMYGKAPPDNYGQDTPNG